MKIEEIRKYKQQLAQIAAKYQIKKVSVFGSVMRRESNAASDIDSLIELADNASALGIGGFQYEAVQLYGSEIDVIPTFALSHISDADFVRAVRAEAVDI